MILLYSILGFRDFNKRNEIVEKIIHSKYFQNGKEELKEDNSLKLFESKEQNLWFFSSNLRIYIVLDDVTYEKLFLQYSAPTDFFIKSIKIDLPGIHGKGVNKFFIVKGEDELGFYYSLNKYPTREELTNGLNCIIEQAKLH